MRLTICELGKWGWSAGQAKELNTVCEAEKGDNIRLAVPDFVNTLLFTLFTDYLWYCYCYTVNVKAS